CLLNPADKVVYNIVCPLTAVPALFFPSAGSCLKGFRKDKLYSCAPMAMMSYSGDAEPSAQGNKLVLCGLFGNGVGVDKKSGGVECVGVAMKFNADTSLH